MTWVSSIGLFVATLALLGTPSAALTQDEQDSADIEDALGNWLQGWEQGDVELAVKDYSEDADFTNAFGMTRRGRADIRDLLNVVFSLDFVMAGDTAYSAPEVRFLSANIALVRTSAERQGQLTTDGESLGVRRTAHLRVFEKREGQWVIVSHLISDARDTERAEH